MKTARNLCILTAILFTISAAGASREVRVINPADGVSLGATLSYPDAKLPKAVVVFATGSGIQNRDEEIAGIPLFRTIADSLVAAGYACLRADDRGFDDISQIKGAVNDTFVGDIRAALALADSLFKGVPTGVLGHSEGGTTAIKTAVRDSLCRFIITLAAPAWQGDSIIMSQTRAIATAATGSWEQEAEQRKILDIVMHMPPMLASLQLNAILAEKAGASASLPEVKLRLKQTVDTMCSPWYRDMLKYNPEKDIEAVAVPWLAMGGDKDLQVLPDNLNTIKEHNSEASIALVAGHNHLFQNCASGDINMYPVQGTVSPQTIAIIRDWLDEIFK